AGLLNLRLAGVDVSPAGLSYLTKDLRLSGRPVTFTVIKPTEGNSDAADAEVEFRKNALSRLNLNLELVRRGYARVYPPEHPSHLKALQSNASYSRLITRLLTSEKIAERRGIGVFERPGVVESLRSLPSASKELVRTSTITKLLVLLFEILRDLTFLLIEAARQGYYISVATGRYVVDGYRRLGRTVDRWTSFYAAQKRRLQARRSKQP
ncbi:Protein F32A11.1, partial [Aphelenchoides avenae]